MRDTTVIISLYGTFRPANPETPTQDAYSLFLARAALDGVNAVYTDTAVPDAWGMNDASERWGTTGNVSWFQVSLRPGPGPRGLLPIASLVRTAIAATARAGELVIDGVQVLAPMHLAGRGLSAVGAMRNWFQDVPDSAAATSAILSIDSGSARDVRRGREALQHSIVGPLLEPVVTAARVLPKRTWVAQRPSPVVPIWLGDEHARSSYALELREWSAASMAYVLAAATEACHDAGVNDMTVLDLVRTPMDGAVRGGGGAAGGVDA